MCCDKILIGCFVMGLTRFDGHLGGGGLKESADE
jgi:hypothetical protein